MPTIDRAQILISHAAGKQQSHFKAAICTVVNPVCKWYVTAAKMFGISILYPSITALGAATDNLEYLSLERMAYGNYLSWKPLPK